MKYVFNPFTATFDLVNTPPAPDGTIYISGDENTDGSWRLRVNDEGNLEFEKRVLGDWVYAGGFSI